MFILCTDVYLNICNICPCFMAFSSCCKGLFDNILESLNKILDVCTLCDVVAAEIHENDVRMVVLHFDELVLKFSFC